MHVVVNIISILLTKKKKKKKKRKEKKRKKDNVAQFHAFVLLNLSFSFIGNLVII